MIVLNTDMCRDLCFIPCISITAKQISNFYITAHFIIDSKCLELGRINMSKNRQQQGKSCQINLKMRIVLYFLQASYYQIYKI